MTSIFEFSDTKGDLARIFYDLLIKKDLVSYENVLTIAEGKPCVKPSSSKYYSTLKKVVPEVIREMKGYGYNIINVREGRNTRYRYDGVDPDPLRNIHEAIRIVNLKDTIERNIALRRAFRVTYHPFNKDKLELIFHPHKVCLYNNRWFAFGVSEKEDKPNPLRKVILGIDRIEGEVKWAKDFKYIEQEQNEYDYLKEMVGVTLERDSKVEEVVLRAHDQYTYGRIVHKPMHHSQREKMKFVAVADGGNGYGDVVLKVRPNKELVAQILQYGYLLEVIEPQSLRQRVADEVKKINDRYNGS